MIPMMSPDNRGWILRQAQKLPFTERAAFLEGECTGDLALRLSVEAHLD
jgi:hypothetical protein